MQPHSTPCIWNVLYFSRFLQCTWRMPSCTMFISFNISCLMYSWHHIDRIQSEVSRPHISLHPNCNIVVPGCSVGCSCADPFGLPCWPHWQCCQSLHRAVVRGGGSLEALAFSSTGPRTWLLFSALGKVRVDIALPSQVHDDSPCPPSWGMQPCGH